MNDATSSTGMSTLPPTYLARVAERIVAAVLARPPLDLVELEQIADALGVSTESLLPPVHVLPITCQPWCEFADGHPGESSVEDQECVSTEIKVDLSRHDHIHYTPGGLSPDFLVTYAVEGPVQPLVVRLGHNGKRAVELTPAEAGQLIEALQLVLGQVSS